MLSRTSVNCQPIQVQSRSIKKSKIKTGVELGIGNWAFLN